MTRTQVIPFFPLFQDRAFSKYPGKRLDQVLFHLLLCLFPDRGQGQERCPCTAGITGLREIIQAVFLVVRMVRPEHCPHAAPDLVPEYLVSSNRGKASRRTAW